MLLPSGPCDRTEHKHLRKRLSCSQIAECPADGAPFHYDCLRHVNEAVVHHNPARCSKDQLAGQTAPNKEGGLFHGAWKRSSSTWMQLTSTKPHVCQPLKHTLDLAGWRPHSSGMYPPIDGVRCHERGRHQCAKHLFCQIVQLNRGWRLQLIGLTLARQQSRPCCHQNATMAGPAA